MEKMLLRVLGITHSKSPSESYALILADEKERRVPIIVGAFEAQAIAMRLEGFQPSRPLTHDLFYDVALSFGIVVTEVYIYKLEDGTFFAQMTCISDNRGPMVMECRIVDAVALSLYFNAPVYTTEEILQKVGVSIDDDGLIDKIEKELNIEHDPMENLEDLEQLLSQAVKEENYEEASRIRDEIRRMQG